MDYKSLDTILNYLYISEGYKSHVNYNRYLSQESVNKENSISERRFNYYCNLLLNLGLVDYQRGNYGGSGLHLYVINHKGLDLINSGKSTSDAHNDIIKKEQLETKILESTISSARLNKIQLWVTIILGAVSAISIASLFYQCEANKIAKRNLEIVERTYQLELENTQKKVD